MSSSRLLLHEAVDCCALQLEVRRFSALPATRADSVCNPQLCIAVRHALQPFAVLARVETLDNCQKNISDALECLWDVERNDSLLRRISSAMRRRTVEAKSTYKDTRRLRRIGLAKLSCLWMQTHALVVLCLDLTHPDPARHSNNLSKRTLEKYFRLKPTDYHLKSKRPFLSRILETESGIEAYLSAAKALKDLTPIRRLAPSSTSLKALRPLWRDIEHQLNLNLPYEFGPEQVIIACFVELTRQTFNWLSGAERVSNELLRFSETTILGSQGNFQSQARISFAAQSNQLDDSSDSILKLNEPPDLGIPALQAETPSDRVLIEGFDESRYHTNLPLNPHRLVPVGTVEPPKPIKQTFASLTNNSLFAAATNSNVGQGETAPQSQPSADASQALSVAHRALVPTKSLGHCYYDPSLPLKFSTLKAAPFELGPRASHIPENSSVAKSDTPLEKRPKAFHEAVNVSLNAALRLSDNLASRPAVSLESRFTSAALEHDRLTSEVSVKTPAICATEEPRSANPSIALSVTENAASSLDALPAQASHTLLAYKSKNSSTTADVTWRQETPASFASVAAKTSCATDLGSSPHQSEQQQSKRVVISQTEDDVPVASVRLSDSDMIKYPALLPKSSSINPSGSVFLGVRAPAPPRAVILTQVCRPHSETSRRDAPPLVHEIPGNLLPTNAPLGSARLVPPLINNTGGERVGAKNTCATVSLLNVNKVLQTAQSTETPGKGQDRRTEEIQEKTRKRPRSSKIGPSAYDVIADLVKLDPKYSTAIDLAIKAGKRNRRDVASRNRASTSSVVDGSGCDNIDEKAWDDSGDLIDQELVSQSVVEKLRANAALVW